MLFCNIVLFSELFFSFFNISSESNSKNLLFRNLMNIFKNFNNLWKHNNSFHNFFQNLRNFNYFFNSGVNRHISMLNSFNNLNLSFNVIDCVCNLF